MTAKIIKFPSLNAKQIKIPLYNEEQIIATVISVNIFLDQLEKYDSTNIDKLDPELALTCLTSALYSDIFSDKFKEIVNKIITSVEY